jgi:hypothetical protein
VYYNYSYGGNGFWDDYGHFILLSALMQDQQNQMQASSYYAPQSGVDAASANYGAPAPSGSHTVLVVVLLALGLLVIIAVLRYVI